MSTIYADVIRLNRDTIANVLTDLESGQFGVAYNDDCLVIKDTGGSIHLIYSTGETISQTKNAISIKDPVANISSLPASPSAGDFAYVLAEENWYTYNGSEWVQMGGANIADMGDVALDALSSGQQLQFNGSSWINITPTLANLSDTNITSLATGDVLRWDSATGKWVNTPLASVPSTGFFEAEKTIYVSNNGDDGNAGLDANSPKLTIAAALAYVATQSPSESSRWALICEDSSAFAETFTVPSHVALIAPNSHFTGTISQSSRSAVHIDTITTSGDSFVYAAGATLFGAIYTYAREVTTAGNAVKHYESTPRETDWLCTFVKVVGTGSSSYPLFLLNTDGKLIVSAEKIYNSNPSAIAFKLQGSGSIVHHGGEIVLTGTSSKIIVNEGTSSTAKFTGDGSRAYASSIVDHANTTEAISALTYAECLSQNGKPWIVTSATSGGEVRANCGYINSKYEGCWTLPASGSTTKILVSDATKRTVSTTDTVPKTLAEACVAGSNVTVTKTTDPATGSETLVFASTAGAGTGGSLQDAYDTSPVVSIGASDPIVLVPADTSTSAIEVKPVGMSSSDPYSVSVKEGVVDVRDIDPSTKEVKSKHTVTAGASTVSAYSEIPAKGQAGGYVSTTTSQLKASRLDSFATIEDTASPTATTHYGTSATGAENHAVKSEAGKSSVSLVASGTSVALESDHANTKAKLDLVTGTHSLKQDVTPLASLIQLLRGSHAKWNISESEDENTLMLKLYNDDTAGSYQSFSVQQSGTASGDDQITILSNYRKGTETLRFSDSNAATFLEVKRGGVTIKLDPAAGLLLGAYTLPLTDGVSGQVPTTNGSGVVSWSTPTVAVEGPASSTDNAITRFDGTTGKKVQASLASVSDTGALKYVGHSYSTPHALTDGATVYIDSRDGDIYTLTLGGNRAIDNISNHPAGMTWQLFITQDATGGRTVEWGTGYKWPGGQAPVLSTAAGAVDVFSFTQISGYSYGVFVKDFK